MVRVKRGFVARHKRKKILKRAKGFRGSLSRLIRSAKQAVIRSKDYATKHRRKKKGDFRSLWIVRINAGARELGLNYGQLMHGLKKAKIALDRKVLADLAVTDPAAFKKIVEAAKASLPAGRAPKK
jgi:large subunit ribosomal protein L20